MMGSPLSNSVVANKFKGCLVGALIGDCLGAPFEENYRASKTVLNSFFTKILNGESKEIHNFTDDTTMTISVAKSLIIKKKIDCADLAKRFVNEYFRKPHFGHLLGYGNHVIHVFKELRKTEFSDVFLPARNQFNGSGSYGNGAAMRVAPIALFNHDKDDDIIKNAVEECSFITHTHPNGSNGAILQCLAVHSALKLDPSKELDPVEFLSQLEDKMRKIETKKDAPFCESLQKMKNIYLEKREDISAEEVAEYLGNDITALKSVPTAIYSFLKSLKPIQDYESPNPFVRAIYFAVSVGGDTDTIATMAGSIAGAYHGADVIPDNMKKTCEKTNEIEKLAEDLFNVSQA